MSQSHYRALLSLGLPIVIGQIGVIVLGFADTLSAEFFLQQLQLITEGRLGNVYALGCR